MEFDIILSLVFFAFCAGAIDAAVGGGGLIQIPALMGALPHYPTATVFGTNKLASICGTASAAFSYLKQVKIQWKLLAVIGITAFISSFGGAACVSLIPQEILRPFVLFMLIVIAIYTFFKKQFGQVHFQQEITRKMLLIAGVGVAIGYIVASNISFLKVPESGTKVQTIREISPDVEKPNPAIFNNNAINPTVEIFVGQDAAK